jgi:hypothetical protein
MMSHTHHGALELVYIALTLTTVLWFTYLLNGMPQHSRRPLKTCASRFTALNQCQHHAATV